MTEWYGTSSNLEEGPISMQAVGQPDLSSSLLGALDSPRIPEEAILSLINQQPTFGQRLAQSAAGGVAFMRGQPNPVTGILNQQQAQRVDLATMMSRMNTEQRIRGYQQQQLQMDRARLRQGEERLKHDVANAKELRDQAKNTSIQTILKPLETHTDAKHRQFYWEQVSPIVQKAGGPDLTPFSAELAKRPLSPDQQKQVLALRATMGPDNQPLTAPEIAERMGVDAQAVAAFVPIADSDEARNALGYPTKRRLLADQAKDERESFQYLLDQYGLTDKNPMTPFATQYTMTQFGKPFHQATDDQRKEALDKARVMSVKTEKLPNEVRTALMQFEPFGDPQDPTVIQRALNRKTAKEQQDRLTVLSMTNQLQVAGQIAAAELKRVNLQHSTFAGVESLASRAERLIDEGRRLGLTNNPKAANAIEQELKYWTGGPLSEAAQWHKAWKTLNAQFAQVAKAIEGISGNRLALANTERALSFHPEQYDSYGTQIRVLGEMKGALEEARKALDEDTANVLRQHQNVLGAAGLPSFLSRGIAPAKSTPTSVIPPAPRPGMIRVKKKGGGTGWLDPTDLTDQYEVLK